MRARLAAALGLFVLIGLPAAVAMAPPDTDTSLSDAGQIIGDGGVVVLEPEGWGRQSGSRCWG